MNETYRAFAEFAQTWGLLYFVGIFACVLVYPLSPKRRQEFEHAARLPLSED